MKRFLELKLEYSDEQNTVDVSSRCEKNAVFSFSHSFSIRDLDFDEKRLRCDNDYILEYGTRIYRALFLTGKNSHNLLRPKPQSIILVLVHDSLHYFPWEYAQGEGEIPVVDYFFSRCCAVGEDSPFKVEHIQSPRIVALASHPVDRQISPIKVAEEWDLLKDSIKSIPKAIALQRAIPATVEKMSDLIADQTNAIVHFMGHGGYDMTNRSGYLIFEKENGRLDPVCAHDVKRYLKDKACMVVLNACETAQSGDKGFNSFAAVLSNEGIPYTLGMRFRISDPEAIAFSREFYSKLGRGAIVQEAVRDARLALYRNLSAGAFGLPVLYTATGYIKKFIWPDGTPEVFEYRPKKDINCLKPAQGGFVGRIDELAAIGELLTGGHTKILTIVGPGGQGKTVLAREASLRFSYAWPGGVFAVSFETLPSRESLVKSLASFLNIGFEPGSGCDELEGIAIEYMQSNKVLFVIDNAETLIESMDSGDEDCKKAARFLAELIVTILPSTRASLLITSRAPLHCIGEKTLYLAGLEEKESIDLFRSACGQKTAPGIGQQHVIEDRSHADIDMLARNLNAKVNGHPLGLRLLGIACRHSDCSPEDFLKKYEEALLETTYRYELERHTNISACFKLSIQLLPEALFDLLKKISVFHSLFLPEMADAIFSDIDLERNYQFAGTLLDIGTAEYLEAHMEPSEDIYDADLPLGNSPMIYELLHTLWQRGFLTRELKTITANSQEYGAVFYRLVPVIRIYMETACDLHEKNHPFLMRFGDAYAELAQTISAEMTTNPIKRYMLTQCVEDLERGFEYVSASKRRGYDLSLYSIYSFIGDVRRAGLHAPVNESQSIGSGTKGKSMPHMKSPQSLQLESLCAQSNYSLENGEPEKALELSESALEMSIACREGLYRGQILQNIGIIHHRLNHYKEALKYLDDSRRFFVKQKDHNNTANALNGTALVLLAMQQPKKALDTLRKAYAEMEKIDPQASRGKDTAIEADITHNTGESYRRLNMPDMAKSFFERALQLRRAVNDRRSMCTTEYMLAMTCDELGQGKEAVEWYNKAEASATLIGNQMVKGCCLIRQSILIKHLKPLKAREKLEEAIRLFRQNGNAAFEATAHFNLAMLMKEAFMDFPEAINNLKYALQLMKERDVHYDAAGQSIKKYKKMLSELEHYR